MADAMRAMLDQLMGKDRDKDPSERRKRKWDDEDVCPYFLCNFCPNDLFGNTKSDLGSCGKDHEEALITEFKAEPERVQVRVEKRYLRALQDLIRVVDSRVKRGEERLSLTTDQPAVMAGPYAGELAKKNDSIRALQTEMEKLGEEGMMDEMNECMEKLEVLKSEKEAIELKNKNSGFNADVNAMKMCEICGIWKSENPEDARAKNHFIGKQHIGYGKIRDTIKALEEKHTEFDKKEDKDKGEGDEKKDDRRRDGDRDRRGDRDRERTGDRGKEERPRQRSRSPKRPTTDRDKERDRDRNNRDRGSDRRVSDRDGRRDEKGRDSDRDRGRDKKRSSSKDKERRRRD